MPTVLIFSDKILSPTQTFVQSQVEALKGFKAQYVGLSASRPSLEISGTPILMTAGDARASYWKKEAYKWCGISPAFHRLARKEKADLLHAHFGENGTAAMWLSMATRLPLILSLHGGAEILPDKTLRRERLNLPFYFLRSRLWERASVFLCVSEFVRQKALEHGFPPEKLQVHYTGIDLSKFQPSPDGESEELVVYVGRLVRYKAADHFLRAMQHVQKVRPATQCVILGDGPLRGEYESAAREMGVKCRFLGHQPSPVVREWIRRAAVFCAPSMKNVSDGRSEALGHVFLEAQAMGVPVVSYRHGGIPEAVNHEATGLLAAEGDIAELASYIVRCLENPDYRREMGSRGVKWVQEHFDIAKQNISLERLYTSVARGDKSPAQYRLLQLSQRN